jgi:pyruvate/2-oxoglutarate dehydrogenase complex dihydrolipoamide acyltransferase (E2) component
MATFDQLPAEQRAILELVVGRGQTYDELSGMLGMPASRVRELAREALGNLAPATAARVDADWRGQIADYVLGQQTGPEATATRGHLKRSEPARAWAYSLLDSLGHLYPDGKLPEIPEADASAPPPAAAAPAPTRAEPPREEPRAAAPAPEARPRPSGGVSLSPAAQAVVRRRRIIGGVAGLVLIAVIVLLVTGTFGGGGSDKKSSSTPTTGATSTATAYEVWLYNSPSDAKPLGAQFTDAQGNLQGRGALPSNWQQFKSVILSRERVGSNPKRPAHIVLRATLNNVPASSQQTKNGVKIIAEGVLKPTRGETGTGIAVVLVQGGQDQLVVQAARLQQTTRVLAPATGTGTTPTPTGTTGGG